MLGCSSLYIVFQMYFRGAIIQTKYFSRCICWTSNKSKFLAHLVWLLCQAECRKQASILKIRSQLEPSLHFSLAFLSYLCAPITLFCYASLECLKWLVEHGGSDLSIANDDGHLPLHAAASNGNLSCLQYLATQKGKLKTRSADGGTALHFAAAAGQMECVRWVVQQRGSAKKLDRDKAGGTPIHDAAESNQVYYWTLKKNYKGSNISAVPSILEEDSASHMVWSDSCLINKWPVFKWPNVKKVNYSFKTNDLCLL